MRMKSYLPAMLALWMAAGCERPPAAVDAPPAAEPGAQEIAWFEGEPEAAFALARAEGKPLFLYWGAVWCPPCHYLKNKIFQRPEFVARSRGFVSVYLDGDTERAQTLGEELDVQGYPTVIIFSPEGEEIMRMPSTIPVEEYAEVLDRAMQVMRPVSELVAAVREAGPGSLSPAELKLLAFYSWGQESKTDLPAEEKLGFFRALRAGSPAELEVERSRFLGLFLEEAIRRQGEDEAAPLLAAGERAELDAEVRRLLADRELRNVNLGLALYWSTETVRLLHPEPSPERDRLIAAWSEAARRIEEDGELSADDRVSALLPQIWLSHLAAGADEEKPETPPAVIERLRQRLAWASETVTEKSELQAVVGTMAFALQEAGLEKEVEALLTARMGDTVAPYYFMSLVADLKREESPEEALAWFRDAYEKSEGRYSRFRWGSSYLREAIALAPGDVERIETDSLEVLGELLTFSDAFAGGNFARLASLEEAYREWNADGSRDATIDRIRALVAAACPRFPESGESSQRRRCEGFLSDDKTVAL